MNCDARFRMQRRNTEADKVDYTFELSWHRPDAAMPPADFLRFLENRSRINTFELISNEW